MQFYLGIDVSKAKLDCALRLDNGKIRNKVIANDNNGFNELIDWLEKHQASPVHVCMEATGIYADVISQTPIATFRYFLHHTDHKHANLIRP